MTKRILTEKQCRWARMKFREGYSYSEIAAALFVSRSTLRDSMKHYGVYIKPPKMPKLIYTEE